MTVKFVDSSDSNISLFQTLWYNHMQIQLYHTTIPTIANRPGVCTLGFIPWLLVRSKSYWEDVVNNEYTEISAIMEPPLGVINMAWVCTDVWQLKPQQLTVIFIILALRRNGFCSHPAELEEMVVRTAWPLTQQCVQSCRSFWMWYLLKVMNTAPCFAFKQTICQQNHETVK